MYQSLIHRYAVGLFVGATITILILATTVWVFLTKQKTKRPSLILINNGDSKSLNSDNSKDSGTGESTKRSQEQIYNDCKYLHNML